MGLYVNPPKKAMVFSVDEKSQIQALDRTQPGLPMKRGRAGTMTHDYKRNGTTTLFAALNVLTGDVIGACMPRHRHGEFLAFLKKIDLETPLDLSTDDKRLIIAPSKAFAHRKKFDAAQDAAHKRYGKAFKKLGRFGSAALERVEKLAKRE